MKGSNEDIYIKHIPNTQTSHIFIQISLFLF